MSARIFSSTLLLFVLAGAPATAEEAPPKERRTLAKADPEKEKLTKEAELARKEVSLQKKAQATPRAFDEKLVRKVLPAGWTLNTKDLPPGVEGVATGPAIKGARAVVVLSRSGALPQPAEWEGSDALAFLGSTVGTIEVKSVERDGLFGGPEVSAIMRMPDEATAEPTLVRYALTADPEGFMLTIVAPESQFAPLYERIAMLAGKRQTALGSKALPAKKL